MNGEPTVAEYTPTTEFVRGAYRFDRAEIGGVEDRVADAEFGRWLAARGREVAAKAWDEGFNAGFDAEIVRRAMVRGANDLRVNPYREGGRS